MFKNFVRTVCTHPYLALPFLATIFSILSGFTEDVMIETILMTLYMVFMFLALYFMRRDAKIKLRRNESAIFKHLGRSPPPSCFLSPVRERFFLVRWWRSWRNKTTLALYRQLPSVYRSPRSALISNTRFVVNRRQFFELKLLGAIETEDCDLAISGLKKLGQPVDWLEQQEESY